MKKILAKAIDIRLKHRHILLSHYEGKISNWDKVKDVIEQAVYDLNTTDFENIIDNLFEHDQVDFRQNYDPTIDSFICRFGHEIVEKAIENTNLKVWSYKTSGQTGHDIGSDYSITIESIS